MPLGRVLPADFAMEITKTSWRSMRTTPVDHWGYWMHIVLSMDEAMHPFLQRLSVGMFAEGAGPDALAILRDGCPIAIAKWPRASSTREDGRYTDTAHDTDADNEKRDATSGFLVHSGHRRRVQSGHERRCEATKMDTPLNTAASSGNNEKDISHTVPLAASEWSVMKDSRIMKDFRDKNSLSEARERPIPSSRCGEERGEGEGRGR